MKRFSFVPKLSVFALTIAMLALAGFAISAFAADAYIIVDKETGRVLDAKNADEKRQIASLTKLANALVVLDMDSLGKLDLGMVVPVPAVAMQAGGANPVGLQEGDSLSMRDLLYCSLLASDNISATTLAYHAGSRLPNPENLLSIDNFVVHMNALARGLKMKRTLFLNPTGLDSGEGTLPFSTVEDLARLTRYAYNDGDVPFFVSQKSRPIHIFRAGKDIPLTITNTNELLGQEAIDGVKTGRTSKAGDCLILSSELRPEVIRDGDTTYVTPRRIIVVLLGSRDRFADGLELTRRGWGLYNAWAKDGRKVSRSNTL